MYKISLLIASVLARETVEITFDPPTICGKLKDVECLKAALAGTDDFSAYIDDKATEMKADKTCGYSENLGVFTEQTTKTVFNPMAIILGAPAPSLDKCTPKVFVTADATKCKDDSAAVDVDLDAKTGIITPKTPMDTPVAGEKIYATFEGCTAKAGDDPKAYLRYDFDFKDSGVLSAAAASLVLPAALAASSIF